LWSAYSGLDYNYFNESDLGYSQFLKYYGYSFKNFYATVIQRAYRNYKKKPKSLAKQVWEAVRNDGTPDRKKFLDILRHEQMVKYPETQEEYAVACDEFHALFKKSYLKYIGKINPAKVIPPYKEYVYCSPSTVDG
jgi:hypothetical protein